MEIQKRHQVVYNGKPVKVAMDFSEETLQLRRDWDESSPILDHKANNKSVE